MSFLVIDYYLTPNLVGVKQQPYYYAHGFGIWLGQLALLFQGPLLTCMVLWLGCHEDQDHLGLLTGALTFCFFFERLFVFPVVYLKQNGGKDFYLKLALLLCNF